jgi:hypothetical protein
MKTQNRHIAIVCAVGMLLLILDSQTACYGASEGITLCIRSLIPSLFPFFVLSILLTGALSGQTIKCLKPIGALCKLPAGSESVFAVCMLGGYPVGAQNISLLLQQGQLSHSAAMRLLGFCNNAGPSFIFGVLGSMFSSKIVPWLLWIVHLLSAFIVGMLLPVAENERTISPQTQQIDFTEALSRAVKLQALVCGWVIFVRVVLAFTEKWIFPYFPLHLQIVFSGLLELSNGCVRLSTLPSEGLRFIIASALLSLGGICVTLQTASAAKGISMRMYFPGKLLQCAISILFCVFLQCIFPAEFRFFCPTVIIVPLILMVFVPFMFNQNNGGIFNCNGV